jgi:quercetin dioxygenase-like cupin family protein
MIRATHTVLVSWLLSIGALVAAIAEQFDFTRVTPSEVEWHNIPGGHGAQEATLAGDPDKPGIYVVRVKFPPHLMDMPHWHPNARYVTVIQGTWYAGTGDVFDLAKATPMPPGSFMVHPARAPHWDGSAGDETVVVQIIGYGPSEGGLVNPNKPYWIEVRR